MEVEDSVDSVEVEGRVDSVEVEGSILRLLNNICYQQDVLFHMT